MIQKIKVCLGNQEWQNRLVLFGLACKKNVQCFDHLVEKNVGFEGLKVIEIGKKSKEVLGIKSDQKII